MFKRRQTGPERGKMMFINLSRAPILIAHMPQIQMFPEDYDAALVGE